MALAATEAELQGILDDVAFTRSYGFRLQAIDEGRCTLTVPFQAAFERPGGIVSGQVLMAAADVAMWLAIMTRLGPRDGSVTAGMTSAVSSNGPATRFRPGSATRTPSAVATKTACATSARAGTWCRCTSAEAARRAARLDLRGRTSGNGAPGAGRRR